ncbi:MAG: adenylosuccinate lyase, partial [Alphaproteobacteria bacterium]
SSDLLVRSYVTPALENVALWHERDISHSAVERIAAPDATTVLDFALSRLTGIVKNLVVYPENMARNVDFLQGLIFSQKILLALTQKNVSREDAYKMVQEKALLAFENKSNFKEDIYNDPKIGTYLSTDDLNQIFNVNDYLKNIDTIFKRCFE